MRCPNIFSLSLLFTIPMILPIAPVSAQQMQWQNPLSMTGQNSASATKSKFEQFPSFAQLSSTDKDGTESVLRCGYTISNDAATKNAAIIDPEYHAITLLNPERHSYSRLEHIKDVTIATFMPPEGQGLVLELVKPDGTLATKNCKTDLNNEMIANCTPAQPLASAAEIRDSDQKITPQCSALLQQNKAEIKPDLANPQQAVLFKSSFAQKVQTLETPEAPEANGSQNR